MKTIVENQRDFFRTGATKELLFRETQLQKLRVLIKENEEEISQALYEDLRKSKAETFKTELALVLDEITYFLKNLRKHLSPKRVSTAIVNQPGASYIYHEPYGVNLIIAPWNYPFQLAMGPLVGAIAGGNTAIVKPSEFTPHTSEVMSRLISKYFKPDYIACVQGGVEETTLLLKERFDHIFFTGSTGVGKVVMSAAAKYLTPVTLELGGKSPVIVDQDVNIEVAAARIAWGKLLNSGQTCVAPDYLFVHETIKGPFLSHLKKKITEFMGSNPMDSGEYPRIVNHQHFERLKSLLDGCNVIYGGETDAESLFFGPTLVDSPAIDSPLMQSEIFGPILPVFSFSDLDEVLDQIAAGEKPLAFYYFGEDRMRQDRAISSVSFGGGCINDTISHLVSHEIPFGGVGASGMGAYHGKSSFECFTHKKGVLKKPTYLDLPVRYAPQKPWKDALLRKMFQ